MWKVLDAVFSIFSNNLMAICKLLSVGSALFLIVYCIFKTSKKP